MDTTAFHRPGLPRQATPPVELEQAVAAPAPEGVVQLGLTTTTDGEWALLARIATSARAPLADVERLARGHPVVYQNASDVLPVARPAYPGIGE